MRKTTRQKTRKINFTQDTLEAEASKALKTKQRLTLYDTNQNSGGLGILIQPTGHASFFWFKKVKRTPVWVNIGKFPALTIEQARGTACAYTGDLGKWRLRDYEGERPSFLGESKSRSSLTLDSLLEEYIERHLRADPKIKNSEKAVKRARWQFNRHLWKWKDRKLGEISRGEVIALRNEIGSKDGKFGPKNGGEREIALKHGRTTANRVASLLRAMYNWALDPDVALWHGENPAKAIKKLPETVRDRYLKPDEMPRFFKALFSEKNIDLRDFVLLALFTGARKSDVFSMRWSELELQRGLWSIPNPKNQKRYTVALGVEAVAALRSRFAHRVIGSEWVFPSESAKLGHIVDVKLGWKKLCKRARLTDIRIHDLRRTLGSWQATSGTSLQIIGKSLGHSSLQATQVYTHLQLDPVRASVEIATAAMLAAAKIRSGRLLEARK